MQYLSHYEFTEASGIINMKTPVYKRLTYGDVNKIELEATNQQTVCRQVPYHNPAVNIFDYPDFDLPTYNEFFFIEKRRPGTPGTPVPGGLFSPSTYFSEFVSGAATGEIHWGED